MSDETSSVLPCDSRKVTLFGKEVEVTEPSLKRTLKTASVLKPVFAKFMSGSVDLSVGDAADNISKLIGLLGSDEGITAVSTVISLFVPFSPAELEEAPLGDMAEVITAVVESGLLARVQKFFIAAGVLKVTKAGQPK